MATYRGIPFNGGLDSPTGAGAANIVATLKAIIDYLQGCTSPGELDDSTGNPAIATNARKLFNATPAPSLDWQNAQAIDPSTNAAALDWVARLLYTTAGAATLDWQNAVLRSADGSPQVSWLAGLVLPSLPTSDPGQPGQLWQDDGILKISL